MLKEHQILFTEAKIGACTLKNRFVMAPMGPAGLADTDGAFTLDAADFYGERAKNGVGLIITGMCYGEDTAEVHNPGSMPSPTKCRMAFVRTGRLITEKVHAYDSRILLQISAGFGRVANHSTAPVAPSEVPYYGDPSVTCRALTTEEVKRIIAGVVRSAVIAKAAGFDGIEIHAMHEGYLLDQFAMACFNHRTDEYGGSLENRIRMAVEIVQGIKAACGERYPVVMRYSTKSYMKGCNSGAVPGEEFKEFGRDTPEGLKIAKLLQDAGYDALDADVGCYDAWYWSHPPMYQKPGLYLDINGELKKAVSIPVITSGRMEDPDLAARAIMENKTDFISMMRPLLADSGVVDHIRRGKTEETRPCLSCQEGCMGRLKDCMHVSCAVNPIACRETRMKLTPAAIGRRVAIIGGGVAGCEAARVLKLRGHMPEIYEMSGRLGGNLIPAGKPDFKKDDRALLRWYERQIDALGIPVHFHCAATPELLSREEYRDVIVATGSEPKQLPLDSRIPVCTADKILNGEVTPGDSVLIVGGGLIGCELALMLVREGKRVNIAEIAPAILSVGGPLCHANKQMLKDLLAFEKVGIYTSASIKRINDNSVLIHNGGDVSLPADTIVTAVGYRGRRQLYDELLKKGDFDTLHVVGDARQVSNIMYAIWDAFEIAREL